MTYTIVFDKEIGKVLKKIPKHDQTRIIEKIKTLALNPRPNKVVALQGNLAGYHRFRIGDYRVIYEIIDKKRIILIVKIAQRGWVYDD